MSSTPSDVTPTRTPFERRVDEVKPSKSDINFVIMDYLINEGYPDAAEKFRAEANINQPGAMDNIQERVDIRNAIVKGDVQSAIEMINDLNPDLLDLSTPLHFQLLRLQLIELIKGCSAATDDITPAIDFASTHLAPIAPTNPDFLRDLEYTMALLVYPPETRSPALTALLDPSLRQQVASTVNEAILESQGFARRARLKSLVRMRAWAEQEGRAKESVSKGIPERLDIWNDDTYEDGDANMDLGGDTAMGDSGGVEYAAAAA